MVHTEHHRFYEFFDIADIKECDGNDAVENIVLPFRFNNLQGSRRKLTAENAPNDAEVGYQNETIQILLPLLYRHYHYISNVLG